MNKQFTLGDPTTGVSITVDTHFAPTHISIPVIDSHTNNIFKKIYRELAQHIMKYLQDNGKDISHLLPDNKQENTPYDTSEMHPTMISTLNLLDEMIMLSQESTDQFNAQYFTASSPDNLLSITTNYYGIIADSYISSTAHKIYAPENIELALKTLYDQTRNECTQLNIELNQKIDTNFKDIVREYGSVSS